MRNLISGNLKNSGKNKGGNGDTYRAQSYGQGGGEGGRGRDSWWEGPGYLHTAIRKIHSPWESADSGNSNWGFVTNKMGGMGRGGREVQEEGTHVTYG